MPVIGRLDEQVNEVLITPLERGRERGPRPAADETTPTPTPATTPTPPASPPPGGETSPPRPELPVWLL